MHNSVILRENEQRLARPTNQSLDSPFTKTCSPVHGRLHVKQQSVNNSLCFVII